MIIVAMAEHESINFGGVDLENGDVVVDRLRHIAEINENIAYFAPTLRLSMHGKPPLADEIETRWRVWAQIASWPPLNCQTASLFCRNEFYDLSVGDYRNGNAVDFRHWRAKWLRARN